jgi:RPA family protein
MNCRVKIMKKYDKEYSTQYSPEKDYLLKNGIKPSFVKIIDNVTTYKYTKTSKLFKLLSLFYK